MSPEAQRIAIAEACGWTYHEPTSEMGGVEMWWKGAENSVWNPWAFPDYLNDLNAMHEAEKVLNLEQFWRYADWLKDNARGLGLGVDEYITATAAQRAEAFLKTIGKWEGSQ